MCEHINVHWIRALPSEVYMCQDCGIIYDLWDPFNYSSVEHPMTANELDAAITQAIEKRTEYLERIRGVLSDYDQEVQP